MHGLEGLKHMASSLVPPIYDPTAHDEIFPVTTEDGWDMADRLAREEGLHVGHSSGANIFCRGEDRRAAPARGHAGAASSRSSPIAETATFAPMKWEKRYVW